MGGGDKAPKSPDYSGLVSFLTDAAKSASAKSSEMYDWAKNAYAQNKGVSDLVINNALGLMDKLSKAYDEDRDFYNKTYKPIEQSLATEAMKLGTPEEQERAAGAAEADVASQFEQARSTAQQNLEQYGVDPSQTRQQALDLGSRVAEAAAQSGAGNQARQAQRDKADALKAQLIGYGQNTANRANANASASGQQGNAAVNSGLATTASGAQTMGTPVQWSSVGTSNIGTAGNIQSQGYQNELNEFKANQNASSGWGEALGIGANLLGKFMGFAEGGGIPEMPETIPDSASPSNGAIPDDIPAETEQGAPLRVSSGEFVIPKDVTSWLGEKGLQQVIIKARKEMNGGDKTRPAQPERGPGPPSFDGAGIPAPG